MRALTLRAALARGALVALANWQVVLLDFAIESFYKLFVAVPIVGGAVMVAAVSGADLGSLVAGGIRTTADAVLASLMTTPAAFAAFVGAVGITAATGAIAMFVLKAGTLTVLLSAERNLPELDQLSFDVESFSQSSGFTLAAVYEGVRRYGRRVATLAAALSAIYAAIAGAYLAGVRYAFELAGSPWMPAAPIVVLVATSVTVLLLGAANLLHDLLRIAVVVSDCDVRQAARRVGSFVLEDARQVIGIFAVVTGIGIIATAGSLLAVGGLGLVAAIPMLSLVTAPLQLAAWILRGLAFQYFGLTALGAYGAHYRRS